MADAKEKALEWKAQGNAALSSKDFGEAIECYTAALKLDPSMHEALSNRSACYLTSEKLEEAETDAAECVRVAPTFSRGWNRLLTAQLAAGRTVAAGETIAAAEERGSDVVSGGTDTHLALIDLTPLGITGRDADEALERAGITCNKNGIPFDPEKPMVTSGVRLGTPAGTTRGFGEAEFRQVADWIVEVVDGLATNGDEGNAAVEAKVRAEVEALCDKFPMYPNL
jgi:tetratricopeptide (TPR) repeat protein